MINNTFCHIDGVSKETEKLLWNNNINDWDTFIEKHSEINFLPQSKIDKIKTELFFSKQNLKENNLRYFREKLDSNEHWRLHNSCKIAFVDIETTGLSRYTDEITMIGIYDGINAKSYIQGIDLEDAKEHLKQFDIIVTFNGKTFDMPFIEYKFGEKYNIIHLDLRWMLKEFGITGGLKKIELELGITRPEEIEGVDGFEAVRLWRRYKQGDQNALTKLLKYNYEDIVNLKTLLDYYISKKTNEIRLQ